MVLALLTAAMTGCAQTGTASTADSQPAPTEAPAQSAASSVAQHEFDYGGAITLVTVDLADGWSIEFGENATYLTNGALDADDSAYTYGVFETQEGYDSFIEEYQSSSAFTMDEASFGSEIEQIVRTEKPGQAMKKKDYLQKLRQDAQEMYRALDDAGPLFHGTSREYKDLKEAAKQLRDLTATLCKLKMAEAKRLKKAQEPAPDPAPKPEIAPRKRKKMNPRTPHPCCDREGRPFLHTHFYRSGSRFLSPFVIYWK